MAPSVTGDRRAAANDDWRCAYLFISWVVLRLDYPGRVVGVEEIHGPCSDPPRHGDGRVPAMLSSSCQHWHLTYATTRMGH